MGSDGAHLVGHRVLGRGGEVGEVAGGAREEVHHLDGSVGSDEEAPPPFAVAKRAAQPLTGLERVGGEGARPPGRHFEAHCATGRAALVVDALYAHRGGLYPGADEPKVARVARVVRGEEQRDPMPLRTVRHEVVHGREEALTGSEVGEDLKV